MILDLIESLYPKNLAKIPKDEFFTNNLNFNPIITKTHNGIILDNLVEDKSYSFHQNEKITMNPQNTNVIVAFFFGCKIA